MGIIRMPPRPIRYPFPKAVGEGYSKGIVLGRVMENETFKDWGDYMRIIDWIKFDDGHKELRFTQYYRKSGGSDNDWFYGQGAGHMSQKTFFSLIRKAQSCPDFGTFEDAFDELIENGINNVL